MDTSETYIKMRRKAIPELGMGIPIECPCNCIVGDIWVDAKGDWYYSTESEVFQLERQDQLQEMLEFPMGTFKDNFWTALSRLHEAAFGPNAMDYLVYSPLSMEQLWLAFVMKECYSKTWNGEEWVTS